MISLFLALPFISLLLIHIPLKDYLRRMAFTLTALVCLFQMGCVLFHPAVFWRSQADGLSRFFSLELICDPLGLIIIFTIALVTLAALIVNRFTTTDEIQRFHFIGLLLVAMIGLNATVLLTDFFSLYLFLEVTSIASFTLIALKKEHNGLEGAFKYFVLSAFATVLMLLAIGILLLVCGQTSYWAVAGAVGDHAASHYVKLAVALFMLGILIKSGVMPFHGWLPDAYSSGPSATGVLLAGIVTKVSGIYVLFRLSLFIFGMNPGIQKILLMLGVISMVFGALGALAQRQLKRLLAYSSISQVGYIVAGLACATPLSIAGALFHFFNHAIFKSLLFVNAASLERQTGSDAMDRMGGLSARMPVTGTTSIIGFLSTAGIPPLSGFWSKFMIIAGLWLAGYHAYALVAVLVSVLTLAYLLMMQRKIFFGPLAAGLDNIQEVPWPLAALQMALAAITVGAGVCFPYVLNTWILPVTAVFVK